MDASNVLIRLARPDDWERVRDIRLRSLADTPNAYGSTIELEAACGQPEWVAWIEGWEGATNVMYLADADGASVGMAVGSREGDEQDAHLYAMWVDPAWRTRGVGSRLVREVLAWGRSWGSRWVILGVTESNDGRPGSTSDWGSPTRASDTASGRAARSRCGSSAASPDRGSATCHA